MKELLFIILITLLSVTSYFDLHKSEFFMKKEINSTQHIYHSDWIKALKPYDQGDENTQKMVSKIEVDEIKLFESQLSLMLGESEMIDEMDKFGIFYAPIVYKDPRKNKEKITNFSFGSGDIKTTIEIEPVSRKLLAYIQTNIMVTLIIYNQILIILTLNS